MAGKSKKPAKPRAGEDKTSLGGKIVRYGQVSATAAGFAARVAADRYLGMKIERESHAQDLLKSLGGLKGPLMKVGQILATIPEALPPEYARAFAELQSNAPPMGWPFVRRRMKGELGADWEGKFKSFEKSAAAAASLGQVHKATGKDGKALACKLQYPDMRTAIAADLAQLKVIFGLYEKYDSAVQTKFIQEELAARLYEELDYEREAKFEKLYRDIFKDEDKIHVPEVIGSLSTPRLLTTTWLEGKKILSFTDAPLAQRNRIALNMFRAWYIPFYHYGIIHGDPHPGNYTVQKDDSINLLDFGCMRVFEPNFVGGVIDLYRALQTGETARAVHAYESWGFKDLNKAQIETLTIWAKFLYGPVLEDKPRLIGEAKGEMYGAATAREVHKRLRESGGVSVPRAFVFMDRAALGLGSVFIHLKAEVNWHRLFNDIIEGFDPKKLERDQKAALRKFDLL